MAPRIFSTFSVLLDFLLPPVCSLCGKVGSGRVTGTVCRECREGFIPISPPLCPICGRPFASGPDHLCSRCREREPAFDLARAGGLYRDSLLTAVQRLKYQGRVHLAENLGQWIWTRWEEYGFSFSPDLVIPVPLHPRRLRARGFNQSVLIARVMARTASLICDPFTLIRLRDTPPQVGLTEKERRKNVRGAFGLSNGCENRIKNKQILLIDDVFTTGATIGECARTLKKGGAESVHVLTLARAE